MKKRKHEKIFLCFSLFVIGVAVFSGCSVIPKKSSASQVEKVAQEYLNEDVSLATQSRDSEKDSVSTDTYYHFKDKRDIEFDVVVTNRHVEIVEPIPLFYTDSISIRSDYKEKVVEYYKEDIEDIFTKYQVEETESGSERLITIFEEDKNLEDIAAMIMEIDAMLNFEMKTMEENAEVAGIKTTWDKEIGGDIQVRIPGSDCRNGYRVYETFEFSDGDEHILTYEEVLRTLYANQTMNQTEEKLHFVRLDGTLYYGTDQIYEDAPELKSSQYDGEMSRYTNNTPQIDGYGSVGAKVPYKFTSNGEVLIYMPDGCRLLKEFTY